ncbi:MerR family transcriptional regulator [Nonomuraea ferruginea]
MDYSIGKLAQLTGLSVKTIRFYSDEGVLPAPGRTPSGYRRYTDEHRVHLELVRTLREIGVDLATIRSLGRRGLKDVLALHLRAVETQLTALQRTRAVLRATLAKDDPADEDLRRLHTLGRLGAAEMETLLDTFIGDVGGSPAQREWLADMRACMAPRAARGPHGRPARRVAGADGPAGRRRVPAQPAGDVRGLLGPPVRPWDVAAGERGHGGGGAAGGRGGGLARRARGGPGARTRPRRHGRRPRRGPARLRPARSARRALLGAGRGRTGPRPRALTHGRRVRLDPPRAQNQS